jgi:glutaredoxin-like protein NrdH
MSKSRTRESGVRGDSLSNLIDSTHLIYYTGNRKMKTLFPDPGTGSAVFSALGRGNSAEVTMKMTRVDGIDKGPILLYTLSTCVWCAKTKKLLEQMGVMYHFIDVDLLPGEEKTAATEEMKTLNPRCSFPTLAINGQCIVGYDEQKIREAVGS